MSNKYKDFDEFFAEKDKDEITFKFAGEEYSVPASMPAIIPIKMDRLANEYGTEAEIPNEETYSLMLKLLPKGKLEELAEDASVDELNEILMWIMNQYSPAVENDEEDDEKN